MLQCFKGQLGKLVNFNRDVTMQTTTFDIPQFPGSAFSVSEKFRCNLIGLRSQKNKPPAKFPRKFALLAKETSLTSDDTVFTKICHVKVVYGGRKIIEIAANC